MGNICKLAVVQLFCVICRIVDANCTSFYRRFSTVLFFLGLLRPHCLWITRNKPYALFSYSKSLQHPFVQVYNRYLWKHFSILECKMWSKRSRDPTGNVVLLRVEDKRTLLLKEFSSVVSD